MAEDMEIFLEQVIKKTNPQEYIKILEQDRQDFAEEIERLDKELDNYKIVLDKIKEIIKKDRVYIAGERNLSHEIEELLEEIE